MTAPSITRHISGGTSRCVQAAFRMIVEAYQGADPGEALADAVTGYVEGRGTWQFRMMLALADLGLHVIDHENFDFRKFVTDPADAIQAQTQDEHVTQLVLAETDLAAETLAARHCIESPRIELIQAVPTFDDVMAQIALGRIVICNVNLQVLEGKPEREGHILLVVDGNDTVVMAHDPGPHGSLGRKFSRDLFQKAWASPSPAMANYISVWK